MFRFVLHLNSGELVEAVTRDYAKPDFGRGIYTGRGNPEAILSRVRKEGFVSINRDGTIDIDSDDNSSAHYPIASIKKIDLFGLGSDGKPILTQDRECYEELMRRARTRREDE